MPSRRACSSTGRRSTGTAESRRATCSPAPTRTASSSCRGGSRTPRPLACSATSPTSTVRRSMVIPARCSSAISSAARERGFTFYAAPDMEFFYFGSADPSAASAAARHVVVLRPHDRRRGRRHPQGDHPHARSARHPCRVLPSRGRAEPARDRLALHRRAHDGRQRDDVPARGEGGRARARRARHLHAKADGAGARVGHAHALLPVRGRHQRLPRSG